MVGEAVFYDDNGNHIVVPNNRPSVVHNAFLGRPLTLEEAYDDFVQRPPRDDTGYIDTTQLEHDVARILEAQGPDWYLQPDEPDPERPTYGRASPTMDKRFNAWVLVSIVGGLVLAALTLLGLLIGSPVLSLVGLAGLFGWVYVAMPKLSWLMVGRWEPALSRSLAIRD
jgi:hypothetical protein